MRYEDASQTGSGQVDARNDADHLAARDFGPATGNVISGIGTITGSAGLDMVGAGAGKITAIDGAGGSDTSFSAGKLSVHGQYGTLSIDARGNYSYERDPGSPAGVSDIFHYTLADKTGATDTARLVINIGDLPKLATEGTRIVPGADGIVTLPAGVELSDIRIIGRDLVVTLPDGSTMIIVDGAIFVPQLVLGGVEVPATNLAALLIGSEPHPAAGDLTSSPNQLSSGGNFEVPVAPLDPGVPLGDLLPPTELGYTPPEFHEIGQVIAKNDPPLIVSSAIAVSEEGLPNALPDTNPGPPQDTTNLSVVSGTVTVSDPNGDPLTVGLGAPPAGLTSGGVSLTWTVSPDGHLLTGSAGSNVVVTISITDAGAYTVTLLRPVDHPAGGGENTTSIVVPVTVFDGDLAAAGSITVTIEDDSPNVSAAAAASGITIDETSAAIPGFPISMTSAAAIITGGGAFGADGPAASGSTSYGLSLTGGVSSLASGLFTSTGHQAITLVQTNATTITGTFGAAQTAFVLVINSNGTATYTQSVALDHVTDGSSADALNDTSTPITLTGLVNATISLTDFDGDSASGSVAIGDRIRVFDDGPSIGLVSGERIEPILTVDETNLGANASASFGGLFAGTPGADGLASQTYALAVTAGASGLVDVVTNEAINLVLNGATVEGRTAGTNQLVFTVVVDANGLVTLDQIRAIQHSPDTGPDQPATLSADNLVRLVATIVDKDGDSASASVDIGQNLVFRDDAPTASVTTATEPTLTVDESLLTTDASASFAGLFTTAYGADTAGSTVYSLSVGVGASGLTDTVSGLAVVLSVNGLGQVEGRAGVGGAIVFVVSVDTAGLVTLDQQRSVVHTSSNNLDTSEGTGLALDSLIALKVTVTDKDGDTATASVNFGSNLTFLDDGPSAAISTTGVSVSHDETPGLQGDANDVASLGTPFVVANAGDDLDVAGTGPIGYALGVGSITGAGSNYGADGAGTTVVSLSVAPGGVNSGLTTTEGTAIWLFNESGAIVGRVGATALVASTGVAAFAVRLNGSSQLEMVQYLSLHHPTGGAASPDESVSILDGAISALTTVTDKDGDSATASVAIGHLISFQDDGPTAVAAKTVTMSNAVGDGSNFLDADNDVDNNMGADGGKVIFTAATLTSLTSQNLTSGLATLNYSLNGDSTVLTATKSTDASVVFTISLQPVGSPDQYLVHVAQPLDSFSTVHFSGGGYQFNGGNDSWAGFVPTGEPVGGTDNNSHDLLLTPAISGANAGTVNTSSIAGGVGTGNSVGATETFRVDFVVDLRGDTSGSGGYGVAGNRDHVFDSHYNTNGASAVFTASSGSTINIAARQDADGNNVVGDGALDGITQLVISYNGISSSLITVTSTLTHYIVNGNDYTVQLNGDGTVNVGGVVGTSGAGAVGTQIAVFTDTVGAVDANPGYNSLEFTWVAGDTFKIGDFAAAVVSTTPVNFTVPITVIDNDGDTVPSGNLSISLTPPVVLDLNGDGVHFLDRSAGVHYDYNGDGVAEATAWASAGDGILVRDANGNGTVDGSSEFVFGGNGLTDMEALHALYGDTLDANDADFSTFKVWQDANSNGVVDNGELVSLTDAGITSISLVSDGQSYTAANGDVVVAGSATFTKADGSTGTAADAAFATGTKTTMLDERVAANSNNVVLAAAVAAVGLAASVPAAATVSDDATPVSHITNMVVSAEPVDMSILNLSTDTAMPALMSEAREAFTMPHFASGSSFATDLGTASIGDLISAHGVSMAPTELLAGSDMATGPMTMLATNVAMPSAEAMMAMGGLTNAQSAISVEKIVAEALHGGGSGGHDINALLNALPGQTNGANAGTEMMTSLGNVAVPTWDTGHGAAFTFAATNAITAEALVLHHDAIQPIANG